MNTDGSNPVTPFEYNEDFEIFDNPEGNQPMNWSPDGKKIAFVRSHRGIYVINADGMFSS